MPKEFNRDVGDDTQSDKDVVEAQDTDVGGGDQQTQQGGTDASSASSSADSASRPFHAELGLGDDFKDKSPQDIAKYLHGQLQGVGKLMQDRESSIYGSPEYRQYLDWKKSQGQPKPTEADKKKDPLWNPPAFDDRVVDLWTVTDENGRRQWKQGTPPDIIRQASEYYAYVSDFDTKFRRNPYDTFAPFVDERIEERVNKLLEERLTQHTTKQRLADYERQNAKWIYETDDAGKPLVGEDGTWKLNPLGKATLDAAQYIARASGDQVELVELARSLVRAQMIEEEYKKLKSSKDAGETQEDKNKAFYKKAAEKTADRGGSLDRPHGGERKFSQNRKQSFMQKAREAMKEAGQAGEDVRWE